MEERLKQILDTIQEIQKKDPNTQMIGGKPIAKEYLYGQRMIEMLHEYDPDPSPALRIACQGQHIERWKIPRADFSRDRKGYLQWRTKEKLMHGKLLSKLVKEAGFEESLAQRVSDLVIKKRLQKDPETRQLEDIICLVFLKYYFGEFSQEHPREKVLDILRKTWSKMTEKGHQMALRLELNEREKALISEALE